AAEEVSSRASAVADLVRVCNRRGRGRGLRQRSGLREAERVTPGPRVAAAGLTRSGGGGGEVDWFQVLRPNPRPLCSKTGTFLNVPHVACAIASARREGITSFNHSFGVSY
ncbi:hypothetical protein THAOC_27316, partial [Thalassiosira oceanica]